MIKRIPLFLLCFLLFHTQSTGQTSARQKVHYSPILSAGMLEGEQGTALQLQLVNGVRYKSWYGGIGVGLDWYRFRGIPLFLDLRKEFRLGSARFFAYADPGIHFGWTTDAEKLQSNAHYGNGFYGDVGLGYLLPLHHDNRMYFSLGYSYKHVPETTQGIAYCPFVGPCVPNTQRMDYYLNRIILKVGIGLF